MLRPLRNRLLAWLIESHPAIFLRLKGLATHPLGADPAFLHLHAQLVRDGEGIQLLSERYSLWSQARRVAGRPGAFAEVGVYRGGSARILCEVKGSAPLHLFDTFAGMPAVNPATDGDFHQGDFGDGSLADVQAYLAGYPGVLFHPGFFPATAAGMAERDPVFQFVHLDVDLYQSTLDGLQFFYPRLAPGGLLISHDYGNPTVPGVRRAFDEFMRGKPEPLVLLPGTQVLLEKHPR
jgi:O-methyltransferase